jgi:hypothetical protein
MYIFAHQNKLTDMNTKRLFLFILLAAPVAAFAQQAGEQKKLTYRTEIFASAASGDYTPFWLVSNRNGMVPLEAGNAYLSAGAFYSQQFRNGIKWNAGADMAVVAPRYRNVMIRQLYAEVAYRPFLLTVGSKEQYRSLWDKELSSGDMVSSANARPIPEIRISIPGFTPVPLTGGRLHIKGDFSAGRFFDTGYLNRFTENSRSVYVKDVLWHYKSLYFRIAPNEYEYFPFSLDIGLQHGAQWGGESTNPRIGVQPHSLSDFVRVVMGREGGKGSTVSDSINVLGNHFGSYDFKLAYKGEKWSLAAYHQRYFDDKSGTIFGNGWDGLWGVQLDMPEVAWLQKILVECLDTRNQTGPFHFIDFDHEKHPGKGGGGDNYYNNGEYTTGLSYFNRGIGSPLLPSPEYNTDGAVGFKHTRIYAWHLGLSGKLSPLVDYRILITQMESWGQHYRPLLNTVDGTAGLLEITYRHPRMPGWLFTGSFAANRGTLVDKGAGFGLSVSKSGIIPIKPKQ